MNQTQASVLFETMPLNNGGKIAVATLNRPQALNSLTLEMCQLLMAQLLQWQSDKEVVLLVLQGEGERAFCAGADLHSLYRSMSDQSGNGNEQASRSTDNPQSRPPSQPGCATSDAWRNPYLRDFFATEHRLDYLLHTYGKPVLAWGGGVVMGGGVGLFIGASHRVVTESTRFAMPEVGIGLFPDVGGSWMLGRLPRYLGRFLGMTGVAINGADVLYLGLADFFVGNAAKTALWPALLACPWSGDTAHDHHLLTQLLQAHVSEPEGNGPLQQHANLLRRAAGTGSFADICAGILALETQSDNWLQKAAQGLRLGAPGSVLLAYTLQEKARTLSLADVFRMEYCVALHCGAQGDFQEGIRALLIDKDRSPRWNPSTLEQADASWVERYFVEPWPASMPHPLADLGT